MTIEIRELVIQAQVVAPDRPHAAPVRSVAQEKSDEAQLVEQITQRVLKKLLENRGWMQ